MNKILQNIEDLDEDEIKEINKQLKMLSEKNLGKYLNNKHYKITLQFEKADD